ncbi:MAG: hypothetical protein OXC65_04830 [Thiotrichales bacterium]|nr:hypothetical protein [Thiotrichales bacterium]
MNARASLWASMAIAASIGLAGCGGSSNNKTNTEDDMEPTAAQLMTEKDSLATAVTNADNARRALDSVQPTDMLIQALDGAVTALDAAIKGLMYDETDKAEAEKSLREARAALSTARTEKGKLDTAATNMANKAKADAGKALLGNNIGLGKIGTAALTAVDTGDNLATINGDGELAFNIWDTTIETPESLPRALKKTQTSVSPLGGWKGAHYERMNDDKEVTDSARVYTSQADAKKQNFGVYAALPSTTNVDGTRTSDGYRITDADGDPNIKGFPTSGSTTYDDDDTVKGSYNGAMGTYTCDNSDGCTVEPHTDGGFDLGDVDEWRFAPDSGDAGMVQTEDDLYLLFGWWLETDPEDDGKPTMASAFYGPVGTLDNDDLQVASGVTTIGGTAKYAGKATGQFAIYRAENKSGDSGDFTADVALTAMFSASNGATDKGGVTGTIDKFVANGASVPWSVELKRAGWTGTAGNFESQTGADAPKAEAIWSLTAGNPDENGDGTWEGRLYHQTAEKDDDKNTTPNIAVGVFEANFGSTHEMVGGFGANLDASN